MEAAKVFYHELIEDENLRINFVVEMAWLMKHPTSGPCTTASQFAERTQYWNTMDRAQQVSCVKFFRRQLQNFCSQLVMSGFIPAEEELPEDSRPRIIVPGRA